MNEKLLVEKILEHPLNYKWSLQGLGMLRLYLSDEVRLHIWDDRYKIKNVSPLHTHPWDFLSTVIAGVVKNVRYNIVKPGLESSKGADPYNTATIKCGVGACTMTPTERVYLSEHETEFYPEGQSYFERHDEIHQSLPQRGTVTLCNRIFHPNVDRDSARVFWEGDGGFVSAEPRTATESEVLCITQNALMWFKSAADKYYVRRSDEPTKPFRVQAGQIVPIDLNETMYARLAPQ